MIRLNRREFMQASAASLLINSVKVSASSGNPVKVEETAKGIQVKGKNYTWEWSPADDRFRLLDKQGLVMTSGILQPAVIVQPGTNKQARKCTPGKLATHTTKDGSFTVNYAGVNGNGKLTVTWRFEDEALWLDPIVYESSQPENVVALHYFAQGTGEDARPTLDRTAPRIATGVEGIDGPFLVVLHPETAGRPAIARAARPAAWPRRYSPPYPRPGIRPRSRLA